MLVTSVVGSCVVIALSAAMLPDKEPVMMDDPGFDSTAFYQSHSTSSDEASRYTTRSTDTGSESTSVPPPSPIAGLTSAQTYNAYIIVEVGKEMGLSERAYIVALATAIQETRLRNLANPKVPASLELTNEGTGTNYDSIGLFQQRPSMGWGTVAQLMDPSQSSARFYARLKKVSGWESLTIAGAAQAVQRSAYPNAYADDADQAQEILNALK